MKFKNRYEWSGNSFLLDLNDERINKFKKIKDETGILPDETWILYYSIAMFILPRLRMFRDKTITFPASMNNIDQWKNILDKMIWSFEQIIRLEQVGYELPKNWKKSWDSYEKQISKGLRLFYKNFLKLWW